MTDELFYAIAIFSHIVAAMIGREVIRGVDLNAFGLVTFYAAMFSIIYTWVSVLM